MFDSPEYTDGYNGDDNNNNNNADSIQTKTGAKRISEWRLLIVDTAIVPISYD